jgi:hypothetical protein
MAEETTSQHRTAAQVQSEIDSTATQWRAAHEWAQATGAGLKERDLQENTTSFDDAVKKCCTHYFLLLDIMKDRASTRPLATSYNGNSDNSSREDDNHEQATDDFPEQVLLLDDDDDDDVGAATTSHQHMSASVDATSVDAPPKKTPSKKPKRKTTSSASMSDASLYGGDLAVASVMAQSAVDRKKQKQAAFAEHLCHNKCMETIWEQELVLGFPRSMYEPMPSVYLLYTAIQHDNSSVCLPNIDDVFNLKEYLKSCLSSLLFHKGTINTYMWCASFCT